MITAAIVDDEHNAVEVIRLLLKKYHPEIKVVGMAYSVKSGIEMIKNVNPDILFLDIELKDGSGFEVAEKTGNIPYKLVFTTAYEQYAIKAFKAKAIDYLLKPINIDDLNHTMERCIMAIEERKTNSLLQLTPINSEKINVPDVDGYRPINQGDVIYLTADSNYTRLYCIQEKSFILAKTLKEFELKLNPQKFIRVHHSHIINLNYVEHFSKGENSSVKMSNGQIIPVSRARKKVLLEKLNSR